MDLSYSPLAIVCDRERELMRRIGEYEARDTPTPRSSIGRYRCT